VLLTNPLDVIRTRLQVNGGNSSATAAAATANSTANSSASSSASCRGAASASATVNRATMWSEAKALWATDGAKALLRGIGPRYVQYNMYYQLHNQL
jgi:Mitochondrial carrier protein